LHYLTGWRNKDKIRALRPNGVTVFRVRKILKVLKKHLRD